MAAISTSIFVTGVGSNALQGNETLIFCTAFLVSLCSCSSPYALEINPSAVSELWP